MHFKRKLATRCPPSENFDCNRELSVQKTKVRANVQAARGFAANSQLSPDLNLEIDHSGSVDESSLSLISIPADGVSGGPSPVSALRRW
jgi:hypothetical protein